jgi:hypothetical protein
VLPKERSALALSYVYFKLNKQGLLVNA